MGFYGRVVVRIDHSKLPKNAINEVRAVLNNYGLSGQKVDVEFFCDTIDFIAYDFLEEFKSELERIKEKYEIKEKFAEVCIYYLDEPDEYVEV